MYTEEDCRRSLPDIYMLCKYYYPQVTLFEVFNELVNLIEAKKVTQNWCPTIRRTVFYKGVFYFNEGYRVVFRNNRTEKLWESKHSPLYCDFVDAFEAKLKNDKQQGQDTKRNKNKHKE